MNSTAGIAYVSLLLNISSALNPPMQSCPSFLTNSSALGYG